MAASRAIHTQGSFHGGVWDAIAHGRFDHPWHRSALETSTNGLPIESGGWIKRSGTQWLGPTYGRDTGYVRTLFGNSSHRFAAVFTTDGSAGAVHFYDEDEIFTDDSDTVDASSSSSGTLSITTSGSTGWSVGQQVVFEDLPATGAAYLNRHLQITAISGADIDLEDDEGNAFTFDTATDAVAGATVRRIARFSTGFLANLNTVQIVNIGILTAGGPITALALCSGYPPQKIEMTVSGASVSLSVSAATFTDGPYRDPQPDTATVSAYTGSITLTPATSTFVAADVGRQVRLFSEPAAWSSSTAYVQGDTVTYDDKWWKYVGGTTYASISGVQPGTLYTASSGVQVLLWAPHPTAGQWAYGTITAQATTSATVSLTTPLNSANGVTVSVWRLGSYVSTGSAYPTCGTLYEGRLFLAGAQDGRIDVSMSNDLLTFSPTDTYGNVFDNHGMGLQLSSQTQDAVRWFSPDRGGLLFGTAAEEYLLSGSSGVNDVITPTNFLIRAISRYGSLSAAAKTNAGFGVVFAHNGGNVVYEYVTDAFTSAPSGRVLNEFSRGLVAGHNGITELSYTESHVPVVWGVGGDGSLLSCTYRRFSRFMSSAPDLAGWADHNLADADRLAVSVCSVNYPSHLTDFDYLYITTTTTGADDGAGIANGVELLRSL